jgi:hypothetical protein
MFCLETEHGLITCMAKCVRFTFIPVYFPHSSEISVSLVQSLFDKMPQTVGKWVLLGFKC